MKCLDMSTLKTLKVLGRKYSFSSMYKYLIWAMTVGSREVTRVNGNPRHPGHIKELGLEI